MKNISFLLALCFIVSCKQKEQPLPEPRYKFTVSNNEGIAFNYDVYRSVEDYNKATNAIANFRLEDNQSMEVDVTNYMSTEKLYVDVYTDDRFYSNVLYLPDVVYDIDSLLEGNDRIRRSQYIDDSISIHYFTHDRKSVKWKGVDYYDYPSYTWTSFPEYKKYFELTLNKDGSCIMYRKDISGTQVVKHGSFRKESVNGLLVWTEDGREYHVYPESVGPGLLNEVFILEDSWKGYICAPAL